MRNGVPAVNKACDSASTSLEVFGDTSLATFSPPLPPAMQLKCAPPAAERDAGGRTPILSAPLQLLAPHVQQAEWQVGVPHRHKQSPRPHGKCVSPQESILQIQACGMLQNDTNQGLPGLVGCAPKLSQVAAGVEYIELTNTKNTEAVVNDNTQDVYSVSSKESARAGQAPTSAAAWIQAIPAHANAISRAPEATQEPSATSAMAHPTASGRNYNQVQPCWQSTATWGLRG
jgi:hypothetical protein